MDTISTRRDWLKRLAAIPALAAAPTLGLVAPRAHAAALDKVKERGRLVVGIYEDMPPFHVGGKGIDVELAEALAAALGVACSLLPFNADDSMNDDLRNMVWRGHYLGYGPADVLMHVPVERPLMTANPQVTIFGPYYRERIAIARDLERVPKLESLQDLANQPIAVPGQSIAGWLLIGADGGAYRERLSTQWKNGAEAAEALRRGEATVAAGLASELESVLTGDARFAIAPLPSPRAPREGWAVGMAVKRDATGLAEALQAALNGLVEQRKIGELFGRAHVAWRPV